MRYFYSVLFLILIATSESSAQKQNCKPHPGTAIVCDSIYKLCRIDAYYMTMISVSKPTSRWYDSIRYPEELMLNYTNAMCALHNDLVDTLADFRTYHYENWADYNTFHPDSTFTLTIDVPREAMDTIERDVWGSGNQRIDSLMNAAGLLFVRGDLLAGLDIRITYKCPPKVNRAFIERKLRRIHPEITMTPVYKYCPYRHAIEGDEGPDQYAITLMETRECMPPESPCQYIRRTFVYQAEWSMRYTKFERGVVPWPSPCIE